MGNLSGILDNVEQSLLTNTFIKRFLDNDTNDEHKVIYKNYLNRLIKYLIFNDEAINNTNEVIDLLLKKNTKVITVLEIFQSIKQAILQNIQDKNINQISLFEEMDAKQNYFLHQYIEAYFKKFSNMQLLLEELETKEFECEHKSKLLEEYKKAVDYSSIVSKTDTNGKIIYVNEKFCQISGYTEAELLGKSHSITKHQDMPQSVYNELWNTIKQGKVWQGKLKNKKKDGNYYMVEATIMPIVDINDNIVEYIAIRKDITDIETKKLEQDVKKATEMRDNVNKAISISINEMLNHIPLSAIYVGYEDIVINTNEQFMELFNIIEDSEIINKLENNTASIYDICSNLDDIVWKYEIETLDNKLQVELKNYDKTKLTMSIKEIDDKVLVVFY